MLELNCSYEESKKILELGYDFSKVCWKSLYEYRDQYNLNQTFIRIHLHGTHLSLASIEDEIKCRMSKYGIVGLVTPIIPKAVLEACLPEFKTNKAWFSMALDKYEEERTFYWAFYPLKAKSSADSETRRPRLLMRYAKNQMLYENIHSAYFDSAFEAFLWVHENYPKELKKKFDEVMG